MFWKKLYTKEEYNKRWPGVSYPFENDPDDGYVVFEEVSDAIVNKIEKKFGYKLPKSFIVHNITVE